MKKLALLLLPFSLTAALPPLWESVAQIKAILSDEHLKDYLDSAEVIESFSRTTDGYLIQTNRSDLKAQIKALTQEHPGPAKYQITFKKE